MTERNLPDEELHHLYHRLAEARKVEDEILSKIYEQVELHMMHKRTIRVMIQNNNNKEDV